MWHIICFSVSLNSGWTCHTFEFCCWIPHKTAVPKFLRNTGKSWSDKPDRLTLRLAARFLFMSSCTLTKPCASFVDSQAHFWISRNTSNGTFFYHMFWQSLFHFNWVNFRTAMYFLFLLWSLHETVTTRSWICNVPCSSPVIFSFRGLLCRRLFIFPLFLHILLWHLPDKVGQNLEGRTLTCAMSFCCQWKIRSNCRWWLLINKSNHVCGATMATLDLGKMPQQWKLNLTEEEAELLEQASSSPALSAKWSLLGMVSSSHLLCLQQWQSLFHPKQRQVKVPNFPLVTRSASFKCEIHPWWVFRCWFRPLENAALWFSLNFLECIHTVCCNKVMSAQNCFRCHSCCLTVDWTI